MKKTTILIFLLIFVFISYPILAQWSASKRLTWNSGESEYPDIVVDSGNKVHIVWRDKTPGTYEIYYKNSTDGGTTWSALKRLTWDPRYSLGTDLAIDSSDNIHLAWNNGISGPIFDVFYKKSTNGGSNWSATKRLTWATGGAGGPDMAVDSNDHIHMSYKVNFSPGSDIFYRKSTNSGANWTKAKRLTWSSGLSWRPDVAVDSNDNIFIVWDDSTPGERELYFKKSTNGGTDWSAIKRLTWNSGPSHFPSMAVDSNDNIHIVWADYTPGNNEIFYKKSTNGGTTWQALKRLTWGSGDTCYPDLAINSRDALIAFWHDSSTGDYEIYYKISTDSGATWSAVSRVTWTTTFSWCPKIAIGSSGDIHLTWIETLGDAEIYYRKKISN